MLVHVAGIRQYDGENRHLELPAISHRKGEPYRVAQITDLHVIHKQPILTSRDDLVRCLQELIDESRPDLIVASGDLTQDGKREELEELRAAFEAVSTPILPFFGGHDGRDLRSAAPDGRGGVRRFEEIIGPAYYSFDWGGVHFVLYANEDSFFSEEAATTKSQWLEQDLALQPESRPIVAFVHTPPRDELLELLCARKVRCILYGHWHSCKSFYHDGVFIAAAPPLCFGGIDTSPRGWRMLEYETPTELCTRLCAGGARALRPSAPVTLTPDTETYRQQWRVTVPGGVHRAIPTLSGDSLFVSLFAEDMADEPGVRCLGVDNGVIRWHADTDASVKNRVVVDDRGHCAAVSVTGRVHLFDAKSGATRWTADLPGAPDRWIYTSPALGDEAVYAGGRLGFGAFDVETGEPAWYRKLGEGDNWSCYAPPLIHGSLLIVQLQRQGLVALRRADGEIVWKRDLKVEYYSAAPAQVGKDCIATAGGANWIALLGAATGETIWQRELEEDTYATTLLASEKHLFVTTSHGHVECRDIRSGDLQWRARTSRDLLDMVPYKRGRCSVHAPPMIFRGALYVAANDGCLHTFDLDDGHPVGRIEFGMPLTAVFATTSESFCVAALDGTLCRYTHES